MDAKDIAIIVQKGNALFTGVHTAIENADFISDKVKVALNAKNREFADAGLGFLLQVLAETFTDSKIIKDAAHAANLTGAINLSGEFTAIESFVEGTIVKLMGGDE